MIERTPFFKDRFSVQATEYRKFRPAYPAELFDYLSSLTHEHETAWDCATGNGQCAIALASRYSKVIATDASSRQLEHSIHHKNVRYRTAPAHQSGLDDNSIDLVTVAQAVHWFSHPRFYHEVSRVLKNHGAIAVWAYHLPVIEPETDQLVQHLYSTVLRSFWEKEISQIQTAYRNLTFPFRTIDTPQFTMKATWNFLQFTGYLETWSAVASCFHETGRNPVERLKAQLEQAWGNPQSEKTISWPLILKAGTPDR